MRFIPSVLAASSLLVLLASGTRGEECSSDISQPLIASIDNSAYFDTCAKGATFNVKTVFDVLQFTSPDFLTFCNSSKCLEPIHKYMKPLDCEIMYMGTLHNLSLEISEVHDKCHHALDAAEGDDHEKTDMSKDMSMDMNGGTTNTPSDSTTVSSDASSIVLMTGSLLSAAILAVLVV